LAVNEAEATPAALVATVIVSVKLANPPLAPEPGEVKVILTPETALEKASFTVTARALVKAVPIVVLCGVVPALAVIVFGAPALTIVAPEVPVIEDVTVSAAVSV